MPRPALLSWLACFATAATAAAHDPGLSSARVRIGPNAIEAVLEVRDADLGGVPLDATALRIEIDGRPGRPLSFESVAAPDGHAAARLRYTRPAGRELRITSMLLARMPYGHRQYLRVEGNGQPAERILDARAPSLELEVEAPGRSASVAGFFALGVEHIAIGYDHLLFLFALLVTCRGLGSVVRVITAFTLAHSVTLVAATLGWIALPGRLVEPLIAASIVAVAVLNLVAVGRARERLALTFAFGLVHGLGFAGVLGELGIGAPGAGLGLRLAAFNLGVEVGQLAIAGAVLPLLSWLRRFTAFRNVGVPACSALAGALGLLWLVERTALL